MVSPWGAGSLSARPVLGIGRVRSLDASLRKETTRGLDVPSGCELDPETAHVSFVFGLRPQGSQGAMASLVGLPRGGEFLEL